MGTLTKIINRVFDENFKKVPLLELGVVESVHERKSEKQTANYECSIKLLSRRTDKNEPLKIEHVPLLTSTMGVVSPPYPEDMVLIAFINGNFNMPIVLGRIYSDSKRAPLYEIGDHKIIIDPERYYSGKKVSDDKIILKFKNGPEIKITKEYMLIKRKKNYIEFQYKEKEPQKLDIVLGANKLKIEENGTIEIHAKKNIIITSDSEIKIKGKKIYLN